MLQESNKRFQQFLRDNRAKIDSKQMQANRAPTKLEQSDSLRDVYAELDVARRLLSIGDFRELVYEPRGKHGGPDFRVQCVDGFTFFAEVKRIRTSQKQRQLMAKSGCEDPIAFREKNKFIIDIEEKLRQLQVGSANILVFKNESDTDDIKGLELGFFDMPLVHKYCKEWTWCRVPKPDPFSLSAPIGPVESEDRRKRLELFKGRWPLLSACYAFSAAESTPPVVGLLNLEARIQLPTAVHSRLLKCLDSRLVSQMEFSNE